MDRDTPDTISDPQPEETPPRADETPEEAAPLESESEYESADTAPPAEDAQEGASPEGESTDAPAEISSERVVEAILFVSDSPLPPSRIVSVLGTGSAREVRQIVKALNAAYEREGHAFRIVEIAGGYQMLTQPEYNTWLRRLKQSRQESKLSPAALETLAIVAYKQPVVRADVEAIRGVSVGEVLNRLRELGLVKIVGRAEDVGRPMLYGTTRHFLETFGLSSLEDLPAVEELQMPG